MMHRSTFEYLMPTEQQLSVMTDMRAAFFALISQVEACVPDGPDRTYIVRKLREAAMWTNVALTRNPDGSPRA